MKKAFRLGLIVGRFQTLHLGHQAMIDTADALCEKVVVFIGSSQESGTAKNPFTYETRKKYLRKVCGRRIKIYPLPDIGVGNTPEWGEYLLKNVTERFGEAPDLLISGKEERRLGWFDGVTGANVAELYIPKAIDISAERMRELLLLDDFGSWKEYCDPRLWDFFPEMRSAVLGSYRNTRTSSL